MFLVIIHAGDEGRAGNEFFFVPTLSSVAWSAPDPPGALGASPDGGARY
jgi:hypothetical protein